MKKYLAIVAIPLALAACGEEAADPALALADCRAEVEAIEAEREAYVAENMGDSGEMPTDLGSGQVSLEELDRFAEMQTRLQEFENRLAVQQASCDALAGGQE